MGGVAASGCELSSEGEAKLSFPSTRNGFGGEVARLLIKNAIYGIRN